MKTILCYDLNGNPTFTAEQHATDQDRVSLQQRHARLVSCLPDLRGALTERDSFFHGQDVYLCQHFPIVRFFFSYFFYVIFFSARLGIHQTACLQATVPILHLGYSGRFIRPIVCA